MEGLTGSYTTQDWAQLTKDWGITLYIISPITGELLDMPSVTLPDSSPKESGWRVAEDRLANIEAIIPKERVIILQEISKEEAKEQIRNLFSTGRTLYYSDIAEELRLDLEMVVEICNELQESGGISIDEGVS